MIKSFSNFLLEKKLFIYQRKFRIDDLESYQIYSPIKINNWMSKYNFDKLAHAMFVSKNPIISNDKVISDIRVSSRDIKNKFWFDESKKYSGYLIEDSELQIGENKVYLFVFKKNSNSKNRARQIHGFKYEGEVKKLNKLTKYGYVDKWDAQGTIDKSFLESRLPKNIDYYNGQEYISLNNEFNDINWNLVENKFKENLFWSIKCISLGKSIDLGDFKRISGIKFENNKLIKNYDRVDKFMFNVAFHDGSGNIVSEYFILMPLEVWKTYLPNFGDYDVFSELENMYNELGNYRLNGLRTKESEIEWNNYLNKYSMITKDKVIKLRFKRDTKGQLRIQASINYPDFIKQVLKNPHIRIK